MLLGVEAELAQELALGAGARGVEAQQIGAGLGNSGNADPGLLIGYVGLAVPEFASAGVNDLSIRRTRRNVGGLNREVEWSIGRKESGFLTATGSQAHIGSGAGGDRLGSRQILAGTNRGGYHDYRDG